MRDSAVAARVAGMSERLTESWPGFADVYRREVHVPPIYPALLGITKGVDGRVWLQLPARMSAADSVTYFVLDPTGRPEFTASIPRGRVTAAAADYAWANETDSLGVASLVRHDLAGSR